MKLQVKYLQNLFYDLLNDYGKVFLLIKYSEKTIIGNRGFTDEEKKSGMILVFNNRNHKNLHWLEDGSITATLGFGLTNKQETCFLHVDDIVSVFSPEAKVKFDRWDVWDTEESINKPEKVEKNQSSDGKIILLDEFRKTKN